MAWRRQICHGQEARTATFLYRSEELSWSQVSNTFHRISLFLRLTKCIGSLAYAEMRQIIARMLWNFDFQLLEGQNDWVDQDIYVVWQKKPLWVRLTPKTRDPEQPDMTA